MKTPLQNEEDVNGVVLIIVSFLLGLVIGATVVDMYYFIQSNNTMHQVHK